MAKQTSQNLISHHGTKHNLRQAYAAIHNTVKAVNNSAHDDELVLCSVCFRTLTQGRCAQQCVVSVEAVCETSKTTTLHA